MNLLHRPRRQKLMSVPLVLAWTHNGIPYRATPWPEVRFERQYGDEWIPVTPGEDVLASAARRFGPADWAPYLEFVPADVRDLLERFGHARMEALQVVARCPSLLEALSATPALTAFVAAHGSLRGSVESRWGELSAVFDRSGIFGVLEWLGLPASRQTLAVLNNLGEPDVPKRLLETLRTMLWEPRAIFVLQRLPVITDAHLARYSHALAA